MKKNNELLDKINDEIKKYEDELKDLSDMLEYHEAKRRICNNAPSMYKHLVEIAKIKTKIEILDDALSFLYILKEDVENEKEL